MPPGRVGCVWELAIVAFERAAWWRHVAAADRPDLDTYLADAMDGCTDLPRPP